MIFKTYMKKKKMVEQLLKQQKIDEENRRLMWYKWLEKQLDEIDKIKKNQPQTLIFTFEKRVEINLNEGEYAENCIVCKNTCHYPCYKNGKIFCSVMNDGQCTICQGTCNWKDHKSESFRYETQYQTDEIRPDVDDFEKKKNISLQYHKLESKKLIHELMILGKRLNRIPQTMTEFEYIEKMINNEFSIEKEGKKQALQDIKEQWNEI
ncbi:unnamed protein product [Paramecium pentaurelia]|uniref:Uncharacterized protein n=1 Tax=Paramecium pentaurelia TaxID=43138 RepID=A0A8S1SRK2_9CILI|nr:unnamed protein product [Paramecium pentaurelia]